MPRLVVAAALVVFAMFSARRRAALAGYDDRTMDDVDRSRAPALPLALPFAIVGAAAGWLLTRFLANPLVDVMDPGAQASAAVAGGVIAGALGAWLGRTCAPVAEAVGTERGPLLVRVGGGLLGAGVLAGALVGAETELSARGVGTGVALGALASALFGPLCALVVAAARRAVRARLGSLVAEIDARTVHVVLAGSLGLATALGLPDWADLDDAGGAHPVAAVIIAGACLAALAVLRRRNHAAVARIDQLANDAAALEPISRAAGGVGTIDLGVGDAVLGRAAVDGYRAGGRAIALLRGDPAAARRAARSGVLVASVALWAVVGAIGLHAIAASAKSRRAYDSALCSRYRFGSCLGLSVLELERGDSSRAITAAERACDYGVSAGCEAAASVAEASYPGAGAPDAAAACAFGAPSCPLERVRTRALADTARAAISAYLEARHRPGTTEHDAPWKLDVRACLEPDGFSACGAAGARLEEEEPTLAALLYARGCERDEAAACRDAAHVYEASLARSADRNAALWHAAVYRKRARTLESPAAP